MSNAVREHPHLVPVLIVVRKSSSPFRRWPLVITFEGPDGAGKSTIAGELERWMTDNGVVVRRGRARPKTSEKLRSSAYDHEDPHGTATRGTFESFTRVALKYGFYLTRWVIETRPTRRPSVLLRERGWLDYEVDRKRYGLSAITRPLVRGLGRLFPRSDFAVVLIGDRFAIHDRKPDLTPAEIDRVMHEWSMLAPRTAHRVVMVDTTSQSPDDALRDLLSWVLEPTS